MTHNAIHAVTGAFGYSGRFIAEELLAKGLVVRTLTNSPSPRDDLLRTRVDVRPLAFHSPQGLVESLRGVDVLYNTYWVRFNHKTFTHSQAVHNTQVLFNAARTAGVRRIVHLSITNPSAGSDLEYFRGKAQLEESLRSLGLSHAILRPAVLFGARDILINNIAWALRHLPVFGVFGDGQYRLQPIHVHDLAELAVACGHATQNQLINAIGPETFTYRGLAVTLREILGCRTPIISVPPSVGYAVGRIISIITRDVTITREEIRGLMGDLLYVHGAPPAGRIRLTEWAREHCHSLGRHYASELGRRSR